MISTILSFIFSNKWLMALIALGISSFGVIFGVHSFLNHEQSLGYEKAKLEYTIKIKEEEKGYADAALIAQQNAKKIEEDLNKKLQDAQNAATLRDQKITELSNNLVTTSNGLRNTIATLRNKLSSDTSASLRIQADTALSLLNECQAEYGEMAKNADQHASDVKLLQDAWPK